MIGKTAAERKQAERRRRAQAGLQRYEIWLHPDEWPIVQRVLRRITKNRTKPPTREHTP